MSTRPDWANITWIPFYTRREARLSILFVLAPEGCGVAWRDIVAFFSRIVAQSRGATHPLLGVGKGKQAVTGGYPAPHYPALVTGLGFPLVEKVTLGEA